ncbi:MAG: sel1 repeat family protein [Lachnospiraceae bacterium]|nr:sel1 repeat family protein [Lachnospiraceae bacterium]
MWKCPACGAENNEIMICAACGFDESRNYEAYRVISLLGEAQRLSYEHARISADVLCRKADALWQEETQDENREEKLETAKQLYVQAADRGSESARLKLKLYFDPKFNAATRPKQDQIRISERAGREQNSQERQRFETPVGPEERDLEYPPIRPENLDFYCAEAARGNAAAQNRLGDCYYYGCGVEKDWSAAAKWYEKAAQKGDVSAQYNLGYCNERGGLSGSLCKEQALFWYRKAAARGSAQAKAALERIMFPNAAGRAAKQQDVPTQNLLGLNYYFGRGVKQDYAAAARSFRRAAERGSSAAQRYLGCCYACGKGVKQDYREAARWFTKAARQGDAAAEGMLGELFYYGRGVKPDYKMAVRFYQKAAKQKDPQAQYSLAYCLEYGLGADQDVSQAICLYREAAAGGCSAARKELESLGILK